MQSWMQMQMKNGKSKRQAAMKGAVTASEGDRRRKGTTTTMDGNEDTQAVVDADEPSEGKSAQSSSVHDN